MEPGAARSALCGSGPVGASGCSAPPHALCGMQTLAGLYLVHVEESSPADGGSPSTDPKETPELCSQ